MRQPCPKCSGTNGYIVVRQGQNCVYCVRCDHWVYNAPKVETGEKKRTVSTVHNGIKPKQRFRILERASGRCELCGSFDGVLVVDHLFSVKDGLDNGMPEEAINSDENLAALCEECNSGKSNLSISPRLYVALLLKRFNGR